MCRHYVMSVVEQLSKQNLSEEDTICMSVLDKNIQSLELQALAMKQTIDSSQELEESQKEALQEVEEQLAECQRYVDQLELTPERLQAFLPNLQHQASRLQRAYQTIQALNPVICDGSLVPSNLQRLINHLKRLEGRLEVIPEEGSEFPEENGMKQWGQQLKEESLAAEKTGNQVG